MKVFILGAAMTNFGELWDQDLRSLAVSACYQALKQSKLDIGAIDGLLVANMSASSLAGQDHLGSLLAGELGIRVPAFKVEGACASGSLAIHTAANMLQSGNYKNILVVGAEKMTDVSAAEATKALSRASDEEWEAFYGVSFPSLYAMIARSHMQKYGTTRKDLARVSVKNHKNALLNPNAQFHKEITIDEVLSAASVADPLGLLDCSPISDGAAAIVLSSDHKSDVEICASAVATDTIALHDRSDLTSLSATKLAAKIAFAQAGLNPEQINLAEVHDCFSIAELIAYEDLGFSAKGMGALDLKQGKYGREGKLPVNVSGGLKGCGHPVGATGVKQTAEIFWQLSGEAGKRQLGKDLQYGLTHNVGGSGGTSVINIYRHV
jgi:acetyl-CoA C-acetyltransferase